MIESFDGEISGEAESGGGDTVAAALVLRCTNLHPR